MRAFLHHTFLYSSLLFLYMGWNYSNIYTSHLNSWLWIANTKTYYTILKNYKQCSILAFSFSQKITRQRSFLIYCLKIVETNSNHHQGKKGLSIYKTYHHQGKKGLSIYKTYHLIIIIGKHRNYRQKKARENGSFPQPVAFNMRCPISKECSKASFGKFCLSTKQYS